MIFTYVHRCTYIHMYVCNRDASRPIEDRPRGVHAGWVAARRDLIQLDPLMVKQ